MVWLSSCFCVSLCSSVHMPPWAWFNISPVGFASTNAQSLRWLPLNPPTPIYKSCSVALWQGCSAALGVLVLLVRRHLEAPAVLDCWNHWVLCVVGCAVHAHIWGYYCPLTRSESEYQEIQVQKCCKELKICILRKSLLFSLYLNSELNANVLGVFNAGVSNNQHPPDY